MWSSIRFTTLYDPSHDRCNLGEKLRRWWGLRSPHLISAIIRPDVVLSLHPITCFMDICAAGQFAHILHQFFKWLPIYRIKSVLEVPHCCSNSKVSSRHAIIIQLVLSVFYLMTVYSTNVTMALDRLLHSISCILQRLGQSLISSLRSSKFNCLVSFAVKEAI